MENWVFSDSLYKAVRNWWDSCDDRSDEEPLTELELRAIVLQLMAAEYEEFERFDCDDRDPDFETPLAVLRGLEWSDDRECPSQLMVGDDNRIYYSFDC